jgi:hypothetical protein
LIKLNLGAGDIPLDGYQNLDAKRGDSIYPLAFDDGSVDEIRASHVLEHFPHAQAHSVLAHWVSKLKPGGQLKVAVPDFKLIAEGYLAKEEKPFTGYLMGGQVDELDYHKSIFDRDTLEYLMRASGLVGINGWESTAQDCAALPISLNLCGWKRPEKWPRTEALMSVPRLGFMDNFFCCFDALVPLRIGIKKFTGAFWGQCMERGMEEILRDDSPEFILTLDYDTVFSREDVEDMLALMVANPDVDALAPIQASRSRSSPLFVVRSEDAKEKVRGIADNVMELRTDYFDAPCAKAYTAHFGCTLIRASALKDLAKPWFYSKPNPEGSWGVGHEDDDIYFWHRFHEAGKKLCIASRVAVGHLELMVRWPNEQMQATYQHHSEYAESGKPEVVWQ